jgi:hypothetical protein
MLKSQSKFDVNFLKMGHGILYASDNSFFSKLIESHQRKSGIRERDAIWTHCEISGGQQHSVNIKLPRATIADITKDHKGRYIRIVRYTSQDWDRLRYKLAYFSASLCNKRYDLRGLARFKLGLIGQNPGSFFCSEGFIWAHKMVFKELSGLVESDWMPGNIAASDMFQKVWEGVIE